MKGVVFTIDAVFAIMVAGIAISILLYFHYTPTNQYNQGFSSISALVSILSNTNLGNFTASPLAGQMNAQYAAQNQTWPQAYQSSAGYASNNDGPNTDSLLAVINSSEPISRINLISGDGRLYYITSGPVAPHSALIGIQTYLQSSITPLLSAGTYQSQSPSEISSDLVYGGALIYASNTTLVSTSGWINRNALPSSSSIVSAPMVGYGSMILVPVYTAGNSAETGIFGFYSNNGTEAWSINTVGEVNSIAMVSGTIAAGIGNTIVAYSFSNSGVPINLYSKAYPYPITRVASFNGMPYAADAQSVAGISVYNDTLFSQSTSNYVSANGFVESGSWTVRMPAYVGNAPADAQPIASDGNLYTLWSNDYLVDQNPYNGNIKWITHIPYSGPFSPYMMLAYGKLYVATEHRILVFGTCPGNSGKSLLSNMISFYANYLSSCADNLLISVNPAQNASIIFSNISPTYPPIKNVMFPYVMNFNTNKSYVNAGNSTSLSPEAGSSGQMSLCTWYMITSLSEYNGALIKGKGAPSNGNAWEYTLDQFGTHGGKIHPSFTVWNPSGANIASGQANSVTFNSMLDNWVFACFTYDYPGQKAYYYLNGVQNPASITAANGPAAAGTGALILGSGENYSNSAKPGYSALEMADLQIYSTVLTQAQIKTLYDQGITASPIQSNGLVGWWPLAGDANDYSGNGNTGFPYVVTAAYSGFISPGYSSSYSISIARSPVMADVNWLFGSVGVGEYYASQNPFSVAYSAGVYSWK